MLVTAAQSFGQLIAMGEEIETGLKKGWYSESGSSSKRFTGKKDKEHAPEVNMTYVQKTPPAPETTIYHPKKATSLWAARPKRLTPKNANPLSLLHFDIISASRAEEEELHKFVSYKELIPPLLQGQSPLPPSINDTFHSAGVVGGYEHLNLSPTEDDLGFIFPESLQALTDSPKKHGKAILVSLSDDSEDDQSPCIFKKPESKVVDFNDDIPYLTGWFAETSIGAITGGPLEGMGAGPQA
ncbi:hypothetical protein NL676_029091 [Syzygium grande]|nr:hypothetical protein NL676_029091 [Syzygium grande]